jgi:hypothetical protein
MQDDIYKQEKRRVLMGKKYHNRAVGRSQLLKAGVLALIMSALMFCCSSIPMLPSVQQARAAEIIKDADATARQHEITGKSEIREKSASVLAEQVSAPEPSQAAADAPVGKHISAAASQGQVVDAASAPTVGSAQEASPGSDVPQYKETIMQMQQSIVKEPAQGTPEEELISAFTDWFLEFFPQKTENPDFHLQTNREYTITRPDDRYEVRLAPFTVFIGEKDAIDLSPIVFTFQTQGKDKLAVTLHLPDTAPILTAGTPVAELKIGSQHISGTWDRTMSSFDRADVKLGNLAIQDSTSNERIEIKKLVFGTLCSRDGHDVWKEALQSDIVDLSFVTDELAVTIGHIAASFNLDGSNFTRYAAVKKSMQGTVKQLEDMNLPEMKKYFNNIDEYLQILHAYTTSVAIQDINVLSDGNTFTLDAIDMAGAVHKEAPGGNIVYTSTATAQGLAFTEKADPQQPQPASTAVKRIGFVGEGSLKPIPPNLFADLFTVIEGMENVKDEESDTYAANHGLAFATKILELIEGYCAEINLKGLTIVNATPHPVTLETAKLAGGFDVGTGEGGTIHTHLNFSGFDGIGQKEKNIPQSANFYLELKKIPSLLKLVASPEALATGNIEQIKGQILMNGMNSLMTSALTLSLADTFVAFPDSRLSLNFLAHIDNKAKYLSTGNVNVAVENPDEFMRIVKSFGADQDMQKMLTTITALANRTDEHGTIVDNIDAKINADGKVFINSKDVTLMFFTEPATPQQSAAPPTVQ